MGKTVKENKVLIITGGSIEKEFFVNFMLKKDYTIIIAADRGLNMADELNLPLDFIVGDFDSVSKTLLNKYQALSTQIQSFPPEKDKTDTQIAIELALMHGATSIDLVGATGSRMDHVLANIHLLMLPLQLGVDAFLIDRNNKIYLIQEKFFIEKESQFGNYISLIPFSDKVTGISLKGFKYPLINTTLLQGSSLGISNEITEEQASIEIKEGILVVIESKD